MAGMEQSTISMRSEAVRINNQMRVQKMTVTKNVTKWLLLLDHFKREQNNCNSPLLLQSTTEVHSFYKRTTDHLSRLDSSMQRYLDLSVQTFTGGEEGDLDRKIEQNSAQMDKYTKAVEDIKINNIETFRQIHLILHPPQSLRQQPIRQLHSQVQTSVSFKPCPYLRPSLLVHDCTLKVVEHFNE